MYLATTQKAFGRLSWQPSLPIVPQMLAYALSSSTWWAVVFLTAVCVLSILGLLAKILRYELLLIKVVSSARKMRTSLEQSIEEAERANNPEAAAASQALKDAKEAPSEDQSDDAEQSTGEEDQAPVNDEPSDVVETEDIDTQENIAAAA